MGRDMMTAARLITCVGCDSQAVSRGSVASHLASTHDTQLRERREDEEALRRFFRRTGRSTTTARCNAGGPGLRQCRRVNAVSWCGLDTELTAT